MLRAWSSLAASHKKNALSRFCYRERARDRKGVIQAQLAASLWPYRINGSVPTQAPPIILLFKIPAFYYFWELL
jgi:hypothetical protein